MSWCWWWDSNSHCLRITGPAPHRFKQLGHQRRTGQPNSRRLFQSLGRSHRHLDTRCVFEAEQLSVHNRVFAHPQDGREFEALVRYMMRSPVSLTRLRFTPGAKEVVYARKGGHDASEPGEDERVDAEEFVARVLVQIPDPRRHLVRYYGAYSNRAPLPRSGRP